MSSFTYAKFFEEYNLETPNFVKFLRYAKRINFSGYDYVFFPVHEPGHWTLVVAYPKQLKLCYYDSYGAQNKLCLELFEAFFQARGKVNPAEASFKQDWTLEFIGPSSRERIPAQTDSHSCGLFVLALADSISAGRSRDQWGYSQENMDIFRNLVFCLMKIFQKQ